jgi:hypothetical protein
MLPQSGPPWRRLRDAKVIKELENDDERRAEFIADYDDEDWGEDAPTES